MKNGKGEYKWKDGSRYVGEYLNDKKHGRGVFQWPNGKMYVGEWRMGKKHAKGYEVKDGK